MKSGVNNFNFRLYTDDAKLIFSNQNVISIKKYLNVDFNSLQTIKCLYIRRKIKLNAFYSKKEGNSTPTLNITRNENNIKKLVNKFAISKSGKI